jgi:hypothetical protein
MPVLASAEFRRIKALPSRPQTWEKTFEDEAVETMTTWLKTPSGSMQLRPIQARALMELLEHRALFGLIGTGHGKTLISFLAPVVLEAKRPLLLIPANLVEKTIDDMREMSRHWRIHPNIHLLSYDKLSRVQYSTFLQNYNPDWIGADEAHCIGNPNSARSRRFYRFIKRSNAVFTPLSGSFMRKGIKDMAYLMLAALRNKAPIPDNYEDLESWHRALSEGIRDEHRVSPGVLFDFCTEEEKKLGIDGARRGFMRRVLSTPGVVATNDSSTDIPLVISVRHIDVPLKIEDALKKLRDTGTLPTGDLVPSPLRLWDACRQVASGFSYVWNPPAPPEWMQARSEWFSFVRDTIKNPPNGYTCDSPLEVWNLCHQGKLNTPTFSDWENIKRTFKPNPVPVWLSKFLVEDAEKWALETGGIVWVGYSSAYVKESPDDDEEAQDIESVFKDSFSKIPYFGPNDDKIMSYKGPCAASIRAHGTGKNLVQWNKALIMTLPSSGSTLEQLLARHHRVGQKSEEVEVFFYKHTEEIDAALETCKRDAKFVEATSGNRQKILYADLLDHNGKRLK